MDGVGTISHRPLLPDDGQFLFRLYASTRADEVGSWGWPAEQQESLLRMQFRARSQSYAMTYSGASHSILLAGEEPVGSMVVWLGPAEIRLVDIALLPNYRNKGLGGVWLSGLIRQAAAAERPLRLSVHRGNPAIRLYQRLGFSAIEDGPMYIEMEYPCVATESA
jgi:ribosomal protein S18 acetylase RimI-like enzyme